MWSQLLLDAHVINNSGPSPPRDPKEGDAQTSNWGPKVPANMWSPYLGPGYKDAGHKENSAVVSATACIWTTTQNTISTGGKRFLFKT